MPVRLASSLLATVLLALVPTAAGAATGAPPDVDVRAVQPAAPPAPHRVPHGTATAAAASLQAALGDDAVVQPDGLRGGLRFVGRLDGFLTGPSRRPPADVVLAYVRAHRAAFGLTAADLATLRLHRTAPASGFTVLSWTQAAHGVPAFDNGLRATVAADGRLINVSGSPRTGLAAAPVVPTITAAAALGVARRTAGVAGLAPRAGDPQGPRQTTRFAGGATAQLVQLADARRIRLAWRVQLADRTELLDVLVDARTGALLRRADLTAHLGQALVHDYYVGAPQGGIAQPQSLSAWISDPQRLSGNWSHAFADLDANAVASPGEEIPPDGSGDWTAPLTPFTQTASCLRLVCSWNHSAGGSWKTNVRQETVEAFYLANRYYDHLRAAPISFTETAGNFSQTVVKGRGKGKDPIQILVDAGAGLGAGGLPPARYLNNATMATPRDGIPPTLTLLLNSENGFDTSNGNDAATIDHELTHGLIARTVIDDDGNQALAGQGSAINEGLADWYAFDFLNATGDVPDGPDPGEIHMFAAETADRQGIRTEPLDCPVDAPAAACPGAGTAGSGGYTFGDYGRIFGGGTEPHADGEIVAQTVWDLRARLIADHGVDAGIQRADQLVTSGLRLSSVFPTFLDLRNAILQADQATGGADHAAIWEVFAHRGMGYFASTSIDPGDSHPVQDFTLPPDPNGPTGALYGTVTDALTRKPVAGTLVVLNGQVGGLTGTTNKAGVYAIDKLPVGVYERVQIARPGYDVVERRGVAVRAGTPQPVDARLARDWSSSYNGARVAAADGRDNTSIACGPAAAIDQDQTGWATSVPTDKRDPGPKSITIRLKRPVDVHAFAIDPGAYCPAAAIDASSSLADYVIDVATDAKRFHHVAAGRFRATDNYKTNRVRLGHTQRKVRYVRLTARSVQGPRKGAAEPGVSWRFAVGLTELEVYGRP